MRTALLIVVLVLIGAAGLLVWERQRGSAPPISRPTAPPVKPSSPGRGREETRAARAVISYLRALYQPDYQRAYALLSSASRRKYSYREFAAACRQGAADFELNVSPRVEKKDRGLAVTLHLAEEPGTHSFLTVRENGEWKVVYLSGRPTFPYP